MDSYAFYRIVMRASGIDAVEKAQRATAVVFENLRKRLTHEEAEDVCAQLPLDLKAVWERGEVEGRPPLKMRAPEFFARVRQEADLMSDTQARWLTLGVFTALEAQLTPGESHDVLAQLPRGLKEIWAEAAA
jgi:uncharacterized protein (DUF2267 family)